jgi:O-antigen/teichoic acid export membrane protein
MRLIKRIFDAIAKRKSQSKAIGMALSISVINQAVSSGTNFALGLYLVRVLTTADFGLFGIGFAITLLYAGVGDALFLTQMVVHVPDKAPQDKLPYAARMLVALTLFCTLTVAGVEVILATSEMWSQLIHQNLGLGTSIVFASIAYLLKDFFVRHSYTARREGCALWINVSVAMTLVCMMLAQALFTKPLNSEGALWIYATSNMVGALVGFALVRLPIMAVVLKEIIEDAKEAWGGGRWALGGVGVTWSQTQAYMYVTAFFVGPVGVGLANTARILITPAIFLLPAITQLVMPRLAAMRAKNQPKMLEISMLFSIGLVCFAVLYSLVLFGVGDVLAYILIGKYRYDEISPLVAAWCILLIFQFSRIGTVIYLQVTKEFRLLTLLNAISLVVAILIAVLLMQIIGVQGAILGSAVGELIFSVLLYRAVKAKFAKSESKLFCL